jgi:PhnB protein
MERDPDQSPRGGVVPHLTIRDNRGAEAVEFYKSAFGAEEAMRHLAEDGRRLMHAHLRLNGGSVMLNDDFPEFKGGPSAAPASVTLHLQVEDADAWWKRAVDAGATPVFPLEDQFWGDRYGQLKDPFGHIWSIGAAINR